MLRKRRKGAVSVTLLIGLIVAASAYFAFTQSGFSEELPLTCGFNEHIHDELCYFQPELICSLEETRGHTHDDGCYDEELNLKCGKAEVGRHKHNDNCYYVEMELVCGKEEIIWDEATAWDDDIEWHTHSDECYHPALVCGLVEHAHIADCYTCSEADDGQSNLTGQLGDDSNTGVGGETPDPNALTEDSETSDSEESSGDEANTSSPGSNYKPGTGKPPADDKDASDPDVTDPDETETFDDDAETTEPEESDEGEEEAEEEEEPPGEEEEEGENEPVGIVPISFFGDTAQRGRERRLTIPSIVISIHKHVEGEGAVEKIAAADKDEILFEIEANGRPGSNLGTIESIKIKKEHFFDKDEDEYTNVAEVTLVIPIPPDTEEGIYHYEISETPGNDWICLTEPYEIEIEIIDKIMGDVIVKCNGEVIYLNDERTYDIHSHTPTQVMPTNTMVLKEEGQSEYLFYRRYLSVFTFHDIDNEEEEYHFLCADWNMRDPSPGHEMEVVNEILLDHTPQSFAYALFDETMGAKLSLDEFNALFGFGSDAPGSLSPITDRNTRRGLIQFVVWYYQMKHIIPIPPSPSWNWDIPDSDTARPDWSQSYFPEFFMYMDIYRYLTQFYIGYSYGDDPEGLIPYYFGILRTINKMMEYYNSTSYGKPITELILIYTPDENKVGSGTIEVGYEGYIPPAHDMILTWTGNATVTVNSQTPESNGIVGVKVRPDDKIVVTGVDGYVTFSLADPIYCLVSGRITGVLYHYNANHPLWGHLKSINQAVLIGSAQLAKMDTAVTFYSDKLIFTNYIAMFELPKTIGLGVDTFIITGTVLMLVSATALFTKGVRPARLGIQDVSRARLLSLVGKRTRKRWYSGRLRE